MFDPLLTFLAVVAYGALHSLLASPKVKSWSRRTFGSLSDRLYRLVYNAIGGLTLLPVLAVPAIFPGEVLYRLGLPWMVFTTLGQISALLLLALGLLQTDAWHFLGLRQLLETEESDPQLVVKGLYRWVRHPLYTAGLVFIWLSPIMTTSLLALNLGLTLYIWIGSAFEERRLQAEFGDLYSNYRECVPRLIPQPWRHPCPHVLAD